MHVWALGHFLDAAKLQKNEKDIEKYSEMRENIIKVCQTELLDEDWFIRGITKSGRRIGTKQDQEGKIHLESNAWAVLSGAATQEQGERAMDSVYKYLYTPYGIMLNGPSYTKPDEEVGFVTRVYPGVKENGAIFSHPNPWAWAAECCLGRGDRTWRGARYQIHVENPHGVSKGVRELYVDGEKTDRILPFAAGTRHEVRVIMG